MQTQRISKILPLSMFQQIELLKEEEERIELMVELDHIYHLKLIFKCGLLKKLLMLKEKGNQDKLQKERFQLANHNDFDYYLNHFYLYYFCFHFYSKKFRSKSLFSLFYFILFQNVINIIFLNLQFKDIMNPNDRPIKSNSNGKYNLDFIDWQN